MTKAEPVKIIDLDEFRNEGYLQEVNRQFFHPLGLAIGVYYVNDDPEYTKGYDPEIHKMEGLTIYDIRDDLEGCVFHSLNDKDAQEKHDRIVELWKEKEAVRLERFGWNIQPIGSEVE